MEHKVIKSISEEAKSILVRGQNKGAIDGLSCTADCKVRDLISTRRQYTAHLPCWIDYNVYGPWYYTPHWTSAF